MNTNAVNVRQLAEILVDLALPGLTTAAKDSHDRRHEDGRHIHPRLVGGIYGEDGHVPLPE